MTNKWAAMALGLLKRHRFIEEWMPFLMKTRR